MDWEIRSFCRYQLWEVHGILGADSLHYIMEEQYILNAKVHHCSICVCNQIGNDIQENDSFFLSYPINRRRKFVFVLKMCVSCFTSYCKFISSRVHS